MNEITKEALLPVLKRWEGQDVYVHSEATALLFVRNFQIPLKEAHVAGSGPYRVALRFGESGWLRMEALSHYMVDDAGRLLLAGYDSKDRLNVALELGKEPFPQ